MTHRTKIRLILLVAAALAGAMILIAVLFGVAQ